MTKEEERRYLEQFKRIHPNFPEGEVWDAESPDFILQSGPACLEIELTAIYQDSGDGPESIKKKTESLEQRIADLAAGKLKQEFDFPFELDLQFKNDAVDNKNFKTILDSVIDIASSHLRKVHGEFSIKIDNYREVPKEIYSIELDKNKYTTETLGKVSGAFLAPNPEPYQIQSILDQKEGKLDAYRDNCSTIWLLIVESLEPSSWLDRFEDILQQEYRSSFDRVFGLRSLDNSYIELTVGKAYGYSA